MAPIPVYTDSPIAEKALGVTPKTAAPPEPPAGSGTAPATTTAAPTPTRTYAPAQPGAVPSLPVPTPAQSYNYTGPARPQPGAGPTPRTIPPPPKAGESYSPPAAVATTPYPPQMFIPPPTMVYPAQQTGTSTPVAPPSNLGNLKGMQSLQDCQSLEHPPGYVQNTHASELDRYQRAALQRNESQGGTVPLDEGVGVWDTAKKWAQATGEKLAAAEGEVWKRINKD